MTGTVILDEEKDLLGGRLGSFAKDAQDDKGWELSSWTK